jgi:FtsP/CotA-like multicopper oxidase with cupredoxin domain
VKWINDLRDADGKALRHLLPVDPTLHWANPMGGVEGRDTRPKFDRTPGRYEGPVPLVTHVHGAVGVGDESDGYPEAWYLPADDAIPADYARHGSWYEFFAAKAKQARGTEWGPGYAVFQYPNENRACTLWYHDHTLGMTRLNVYAGPAGFYLVRGGATGDDAVLDARTGKPSVLPGPAPKEGDAAGTAYYEIPIAIQDRAFNDDGSLFYPDSRTYFDGIENPYVPDEEGFSPIWNPEFFGNTIMVNGAVWPYQTVEKRRYRIRFLNGCQSRFLILDFSKIPGVQVSQIGNEGGFLARPVDVMKSGGRILMGLAERMDVIVDFTNVAEGSYVLGNVGPDEPFGGGEPGDDFEPAHEETTGRIIQFKVVAATSKDESTPAKYLKLPKLKDYGKPVVTRRLALIEEAGMGKDAEGKEVEGPVAAMLGVLEGRGEPKPLEWNSPVTENPAPGTVETWEIYNTTADAHPIHVHETVFQVINRQPLARAGEEELARPLRPKGASRRPEPAELGFKDTVTSYPGEVTRIRVKFGSGGQYVWHCHIVDHEDNEMMRPFRIGPQQPGQPAPKPMDEPAGSM